MARDLSRLGRVDNFRGGYSYFLQMLEREIVKMQRKYSETFV